MKKEKICFILFTALTLSISCITPAAACPIGDLSGDCSVSWEDLAIFADQWLETPGTAANLDGLDGVDMVDLAILADNWHKEPARLVINEFMAKNDSFVRDSAGDYEDWIEIYNAGDSAVDIAGMYLTDDLSSPALAWWQVPYGDPGATTIGGGGYLLIWADNEPNQGTLHASFNLRAGGEDIGLFASDGATVDSIEFLQQNANESYGRYPDGNDNWQVFRSGSPPTPGETNGGNYADVVINEIMYHPYHLPDQPEELGLEYIELYNRGNQSVNLSGWQLSDGVNFVFNPLTISAGDYLVVAADVNAFTAKYPGIANVTGGWEGRLSNSGETVELTGPTGQRIDRVKYADEGDWAVRLLGPVDHQHRGWVWSDEHDGGGKSLELINPFVSNNYGQNWAGSLVDNGTPGVINSGFADGIAPMILNVKHTPAVPSSAEPVSVTAKIVSESTSGLTVTVYYRVDGNLNFTAVQMLDVGLHGDGGVGDGVYGTYLPPKSDGTIVEFYIEAQDSAGSGRTCPAPVMVDGTPTQRANLLYQVDNSFDLNPPAGSQPIYYIIMTEVERAELEDIGDDGDVFYGEARSNAQMNATFISADGVGTKLRYNVGVRNRGNRTRIEQPNNHRVNFANDRPFNGVSAININSRYTYAQLIGSVVWRMAGLAAEEAAGVQVRVNGQDLAQTADRMYGSYVAIEVYDSDSAANHFPNDSAGNMYRCNYYVSQGNPNVYANLDYLGTDPDAYRSTYRKQTNGSLNDWSDIINLTYILNDSSTSDAEFIDQVSQVVNIEQWMRHLAVDTLIGNREGGLTTGSGDDYAMYRGAEDQRFQLMPHDLDTILDQGTTPDFDRDIFTYAGVRGLRQLLANPEAVRIYYSQLLELIDTVFKPENFNSLIEQHLQGWVSQAKIDEMKQFVVNRNAGVLNQIPRKLTADSSLEMFDEYYMTADGINVLLSGEFPADRTVSVLVNGFEANLQPAGAIWSLDELPPLKPGINRIIIQAFDGPAGTGSEIDRTYIDILFDSGGQGMIAYLKVPAGSQWKYLDNGSNQGAAWRELNFDDSNWSAGAAQLGYGDNDEATVVSYGGDSTNKYITTYFRHTFNIPEGQAGEFNELTVSLLRDDGAVVYLNGQEIVRENVPTGHNYLTPASATIAREAEDTFYNFSMAPSVLVDGENILAVEIHQDRVSSSDISFDLELIAKGFSSDGGDEPSGTPDLVVEVGSVWKYLDNGSDQGTTWSEPGYDDSNWSAGHAQLGYGDSDEATAVSYGSDPDNKYITTYFRHTFNIPDGEATLYNDLTISLLRDDGAMVYLNGQEIIREHIPIGHDYMTPASETVAGDAEDTFYDFSVDPSVLVDGNNVLAVEIHQQNPASSDISFDLELRAKEITVGGAGEILSGTLTVDKILDAASGPWHIIGNVIVPAGITLEIEPGTTLFFESGSSITVNGHLLAEGSEYELIRFTKEPGTSATWNGVQFVDTMADNRITYAVLEYGRTDDGMIGLDNSNLLLECSMLDHTDFRRIATIDSALIVRNCVFTDILAPGQAPTLDNHNEHIWGHGVPVTGHFIIEGNIFGTTKGHNDGIDFDGPSRPNPIPQILNNIFMGCGDDAVDLESDAHIEGNLFMNIAKDQYNTDPGESNVLSAGAGKDYVVVRNIYYNVDHAAQVKDDASMTFVNNTVVNVNRSAIYFGSAGSAAGWGVYVDGSIFHDANAIFDTSFEPTELSADRSILTIDLLGMGVGNIAEDPRLVDPDGDDFDLCAGSPAIGTGPNGQDMGAKVAGGASISGEPPALTHLTAATLTVGGAGITDYRYSVNGGPWSGEYTVDVPIELTGLTDGEYSVFVIGKNSANAWQNYADAAESKSWTVDTSLSRVLINELLAVNNTAVEYMGAFPDLIELYNDGSVVVDLAGMSISDNRDNPRKYVFSAGTEIPADGYLLLYADSNTTAPGLHLNFALDNQGEGVFLYDTTANGGGLLDSVEFGLQIPDLSIGRIDRDRSWSLTQPTPGTANVAIRLGDPAGLKINEFLANGELTFEDDFIELYNPDPLPVSLAGLYITDNAAAQPDRDRIEPLSFIAGQGYAVYIADGDAGEVPDHLNFSLSAEQEMIGLFDAELKPIDMIIYYSQTMDISQGRSPDGAEDFEFFAPPNPGMANP